MEFAIGDAFLAYRSESLRISLRLPERRLSFRMDGFIFCAKRLMDQLMFYQCPHRLRKRAAQTIRMNDAPTRFDSSISIFANHISITSYGARVRGRSDRIEVRDES
jgi:hypothetical protein